MGAWWTWSPTLPSKQAWTSYTNTSAYDVGPLFNAWIGVIAMSLKSSLGVFAALAFAAAGAHAQISDGVIKIGVMNDQSGTYADLSGPGSVVAARMAAEDFGAAKKGMKVEILVADHQNKPEVGSGIARQGFDVDQVDEVVDV